MSESAASKEIIRELTKSSAVRLFRNQVGTYKLADGRYISSGLCKGSSDFIGWQSVTITPEMVGQKVAVFVALEAKNPGKHEKAEDQKHFIQTVKAAGGKAGFATNIQEAQKILS